MARIGGRFSLERELGSGGMSRVFLGTDEVLGRTVAVKILRAGLDDSDAGLRFQREGRTAAGLSHPNIVQVYDAGEDSYEGRSAPYIVMEYVPGGDLKTLIDRKGPLSVSEVARIGAQISSGLEHAHERGVIHRDIKPHNILLDEQGNPRLTDFGIARALGATQATRTGSFLGTALYSSPEQLRGQRVTFASDIYSLGATLYQAATGAPPFTGPPMEVASQHMTKPPPAPSSIRPGLDRGLEAVILDCLHKDPSKRPEAGQLADRLRNLGTTTTQQASTARMAAPPTRKPPPKRGRRRLASLLGIVALLLLLGLGAGMLALGGGDGNSVSGQQAAQQQGGGGQPAADNGGSQQGGGAEGPSAQQDSESQQQNPQSLNAAEQAVVNHYVSAARGNYDEAWNLLSSRYQNEVGSRQAWTSQFDTLERIEFTELPQARNSENGVTVSFATVAYHTDRTDRRSGTASMVREDGQWKIDGLSF